jgi:hypothetical protein
VAKLGVLISLGVRYVRHHVIKVAFVRGQHKGVFVSLGLVKRLDFIAASPEGKEYPIRQRAEYVPCAGVCYWPLIDNLSRGQTPPARVCNERFDSHSERAPITELGRFLARANRFSPGPHFLTKTKEFLRPNGS